MSPQARMAAGNAPGPEAGVPEGSDAGAGPFVINLTSSTSPMALAHPDAPELKRFSFFVSRRREDNRERFRLHMGYFSTLAEAEEWLNIIRDLYPGAWAGEAPGKKLRARAAATELAKQLPAPPPAIARAAAEASLAAQSSGGSAFSSAPAAPVDINVPTLQAAPALAPPPLQTAIAASAAPMLEAVAQAAAALAAAAKTVVAQSAVTQSAAIDASHTVMAPNPFAPSALGQSQPTFTPAPSAPVVAAPLSQSSRPAVRTGSPVSVSAQPVPAAAKPAAQPRKQQAGVAASAAAAALAVDQSAKKVSSNALTSGSNVREVMASLDESGETRQMPIPPGLRAPAPVSRAPAALPGTSSTPAPRPPAATGGRAAASPAQSVRAPAQSEMPRAAAPPAARGATVETPAAPTTMSDTQVLRMLEVRRADDSDKGSDDANSGISLLKPDDTQTRRALKEAVIENAPVSFAVQLQWSVQPVQLEKVPPLAIFSAYTLYTVEGSREGRKWYGLRLGFFSDAISAKQVAYYVRSEFTSVAVVPVSPAEKGRATDAETKAATGAFQRRHVVEQKIEEFKLFDDDKSMSSESPPKVAEPAKPVARGVPARKNKPLGRVRAKEQRSPKTLEETLEILGASDLEIDNGRGEIINDTGVRHLRVEVQKNTPFAKLLDRISERVRKN
ncbi:MAG: hypothetical protein WDO56_34305 [Gammaproteobacteria bacterium]